MNDEERRIIASVVLRCRRLSDMQLSRLNLAAQRGDDPRRLPGYTLICDLFTEGNGLLMAEDVRAGLHEAARMRINEKAT